MNETNSLFLDNTRKDLIGSITAVVLLAGFLRATSVETTLDSCLSRFLSEESQDIKEFVGRVLSAGLANEMMDEVASILGDLIPAQANYYDKPTASGLLFLYSGEATSKDAFGGGVAVFHATCTHVLEKKLSDLASTTLWCRVEAYERGREASKLDLSLVYASSLALVPTRYRDVFKQSTDWVKAVTRRWRYSEETRRGLRLTGQTESGLTKVLAEI